VVADAGAFLRREEVAGGAFEEALGLRRIRRNRVAHVDHGIDTVQCLLQTCSGEQVHARRAGHRDHGVAPLLQGADRRPADQARRPDHGYPHAILSLRRQASSSLKP
jgi:hypothetical protein